MFPRAMKALLLFLVLSSLVFSACAQTAAGESELDTEALKAKVAAYMIGLFPQLENLQVTEINKSEDTPFLKATITFSNRGRTQENEVNLTADGKYLVLGQIWDLSIDPARARWNEKTEGAAERAAQIDLTDRPSRGPADASVVVVEFSDYQCPYCSRAYETLEGKLIEKYGDQIRFVFKHLPLEQIHPWAKKASVGAACAYVQNPEAFWGMHSRLFENQKQITVENLREKAEAFADELKLDKAAFLDCFDLESTKSVVESDLREASAIGISSTPSFLINGALVAGAVPFEEMSSYIEYALEDAKAAKK